VAYIGDQSYGKFPKDIMDEQILMEYKHFLPLISNYMPETSLLSREPDFLQWLKDSGEENVY
jgi:hypothetical protein